LPYLVKANAEVDWGGDDGGAVEISWDGLIEVEGGGGCEGEGGGESSSLVDLFEGANLQVRPCSTLYAF